MVETPHEARTPVFVIAEAGVNHDGSLEKALQLVEVAAEAGADAVKFQTFRTEEVVTTDAEKADYQKRQTGGGSQFEMIQALELDDADHRRIAAHCADCGIEFMSTPFSAWGLGLLVDLGIKRLKVASGEVPNLPLLRSFAAQRLPVILSTGMSTLPEVERAIDWIRSEWARIDYTPSPYDLIVLHCTSDYPAEPESANLRAMDTMAEAFGLPVGYSDHTLGDAISLAAVARGACVIEKHFTLDRTLPGPDHAASLDPAELKRMVASIRSIEVALGHGRKEPHESEWRTRELVRRSAFAARQIEKGEQYSTDSVQFLRPAGGIGPEHADRVFGVRATRRLAPGDRLTEDDLA